MGWGCSLYHQLQMRCILYHTNLPSSATFQAFVLIYGTNAPTAQFVVFRLLVVVADVGCTRAIIQSIEAKVSSLEIQLIEKIKNKKDNQAYIFCSSAKGFLVTHVGIPSLQPPNFFSVRHINTHMHACKQIILMYILLYYKIMMLILLDKSVIS